MESSFSELRNSLSKNPVQLSDEENARYARQLALQEIGVEGQKKLKGSSILCIGSGGLGSPLLLYLAAAGIGQIGIVDIDVVDESNLQRQVIHGMSWLNKPKTKSACSRIKEINPFCKVSTYETELSSENALEIMKPYDLICDCTDNFPSRYLINDACVILGKPNIYGSVGKFEGQVSVFNLKLDSPNYRDFLPKPPPEGLLPSCAEGGVMGVIPGIIGLIQATEVIKIVTEIGSPLDGRLLIFDGLNMSFRELKLKSHETNKSIKRLINYKKFCSDLSGNISSEEISRIKSISVKELQKRLKSNRNNIILLDVRNPHESKIASIIEAHLIPLSQIKSGVVIDQIKSLTASKQLYVHCKSGKRSAEALKELRNFGIEGTNIIGGIDAWIAAKLPIEEG